MRCMMCEGWSFSHICRPCRNRFLTPTLHKRKILGNLPVYSFYPYSEIEPLLLTKHTDIGYYIYTILASQSFRKFAEEFAYEGTVASIGVDDHVRHGYSHTAILNRSLKSRIITPHYGKLRATEHHQYAGKSIEERLLHPRNFIYSHFSGEEVIVVDDIVTTGTTLTEAVQTVQNHGKKVIFCLTLADAENK